jgi:membrane dipeptidase
MHAALSLLIFCLFYPARLRDEDRVVVSDPAKTLHASALLIDGHNDLPWIVRSNAASSFERYDIAGRLERGHTDIPRLREGGVKGQFWSVYVPADLDNKGGAARTTMEQIDLVYRMVARYPDVLEMAYTADDIQRIAKSGKIASLIGIEGGHAIENSLGALRMFYRLGARYMTLTHTDNLDWADSATDEPWHGGLTEFGEEVVREMNRLGMLVDISHVSADTMRQVLRVSQAPVIASHSSAFALAPHPRNVPDDVLKLVAANGGVVMVNFYSGFIHPDAAKRSAQWHSVRRELRAKYADDAEFRQALDAWEKEHPLPRATLGQVLDHIDHIAQVAGVDHVGIGSDFDGITSTPVGLEDVSCFPRITQGLLDRRYSESDIRKVLGGNLLRAFHEAERVAAKLQRERLPSLERIRSGDRREAARGTPEQMALDYLAREVPRWFDENQCFSCHNNGDAARALYEAQRRGYNVSAQALADTTEWLGRPDTWDENRGDGRFSDKQLARVQFAAALRTAAQSGRQDLRRPLPLAAGLVAENQQPDGSWRIEAAESLGSPATYGTALATWQARESLHAADPQRFREQIARADRWLGEFPMNNVLDAAVACWAAGRLESPVAIQRRRHALEHLRRTQSSDGGWGPYAAAPPEPFDTAIVLLALASASDQDEVRPMLSRGRAFLLATQQPDGSWPETTRPPGAESYAQRLSTTGWATLALLQTSQAD